MKEDSPRIMKISVCTYNSNDFDVIIKDDNENEIVLTGNQKLSDEEFSLINDLAPACVFTTYEQKIIKRE